MTNYTHLTEKEREIIYLGLKNGLKQNIIAKNLNRDAGTISREIKRNSSLIGTNFNNNIEEKNKKENYHYLPDRANNKYKNRKKDAGKLRPILKGGEIFFEVIKRLKDLHSPEIISGRLKEEGKGNISHEAIYQFIYNKNYSYLRLWEFLPRQRKKRKIKTGRKSKRDLIPNRIDISLRDENINNRENIGHWEGDSIEGKRGTGAGLHVSVERYSRLTRIRKLDRKTALNTNNAMIDIFKDIPEILRKTTTVDNGSEFTSWEKTKKELGIKFYFTHPYSSREKGTVERINGFIRRFLPKGTDFNNITEQQIQLIEDWINNRPMTCLNFKTPNEVYNYELLKLSN